MKKYGFGIAVSLLTFGIGVGIVWYLNTWGFLLKSGPYREACLKADEAGNQTKTPYPTSSTAAITTYFKGFVSTKDGLSAEFEIVNHTRQTAYYYGSLWNENDLKGHTYPFVKIDGKEQEQFVCGNGLKTFELKPGDSITFSAYAGFLGYYLQKGKNIQIGFDLSLGDEKNYRKYWSEVLQIPESIRSRFLQEAKEKALL